MACRENSVQVPSVQDVQGPHGVLDKTISNTRITATFDLYRTGKDFEHEICVVLRLNPGFDPPRFLRFEFTVDIGRITSIRPQNVRKGKIMIEATETNKDTAISSVGGSAKVTGTAAGIGMEVGASADKSGTKEHGLTEMFTHEEYTEITGSGENTPKATWTIRPHRGSNSGIPSLISLSTTVNSRPLLLYSSLQVGSAGFAEGWVMLNSVRYFFMVLHRSPCSRVL
jgi:hypothetical protein